MSDVERAIYNLTYAMQWNDRPTNESMEMAIKALRMSEWIPVSERLPELTIDAPIVGKQFTEDVLVYDGADFRVGYLVRNDILDFNYWVVYGEDDYVPIEWMPIEPYKASPTGAESEE